MYNIGDIFKLDNDYPNKAAWCNQNNCRIEQINEEEYTIVKNIITEEQVLEDLRAKREIECFSVVNRGALWYNRLTEEQITELQEWYQEWLDVTETKIIPEKPYWLK